eukprot:5185100-Pleurochrysis_carterae.AAC.1
MRCAEVDVRESDDDNQPAFDKQAGDVDALARKASTRGQRAETLRRLRGRRHAFPSRPTHRYFRTGEVRLRLLYQTPGC